MLSSPSNTRFLTAQTRSSATEIRTGKQVARSHLVQSTASSVGPLLPTTVSVLMSLSNDPHPVVHFRALKSRTTVIDVASSGYAHFVSSTFGMLLKVYILDSRGREDGTYSTSISEVTVQRTLSPVKLLTLSRQSLAQTYTNHPGPGP